MTGRVVVVTGAGRGLGAALVAEAVRLGDIAIAVVRDPEHADMLSGRERVRPVLADVTDFDSLDRLEAALRSVPRVDVLVNNAVIVRPAPTLAETSVADLAACLAVSGTGALAVTRLCADGLSRAEQPSILNVSSRLSTMSAPPTALLPGTISYTYRMAKAALNMLTCCLHEEFGSRRFQVLAVHPGALTTRLAPPDADTTPETAAARVLGLTSRRDLVGVLVDAATGQVLPW